MKILIGVALLLGAAAIYQTWIWRKMRKHNRELRALVPTPQELGRVWQDGEHVKPPLIDGEWGCPNCHGTRFLSGPSAGISTNVICTSCHIKWNANEMGFDWEFLGHAEAEYAEATR